MYLNNENTNIIEENIVKFNNKESNVISEFQIYYLSELSSDSDNGTKIYKKYDITSVQEIYYLSELSSDSDNENINNKTPAV